RGSALRLRRGRKGVEVARAAHRLDALDTVDPRAELLSQVADVLVDAAVERRDLAAERGERQVVARDDGPGRAQQRVEQVELDRCQLDRLAVLEGRARPA